MNQPLPAFRFQVEWGGTRMGFSEVTGLGAEVAVVEYREGNSRRESAIKIPGMKKYSNVTLKRGVMQGDNEFFEWLTQAASGAADERRDLTISLLADDGQPLVQWRLRNALPMKYTGPTLDAAANQVAIEELQLAHEGLTVDAP